MHIEPVIQSCFMHRAYSGAADTSKRENHDEQATRAIPSPDRHGLPRTAAWPVPGGRGLRTAPAPCARPWLGGQEAQMPGPPSQAPAYGWRGQQGQMPAPPPYGGPRDPRTEQRPSPWAPAPPDYRGDREPVWQHDPHREADRWRGPRDAPRGAGAREYGRDAQRPRDDSHDFPRYHRGLWEDEGRRGDRRLQGSERQAEDMHQWQDAEQRRDRRGDGQRGQ